MARSYPIEGCWVRPDWQEAGITPVTLARRQPDGLLMYGTYLVDYYCLGVKDAFCRVALPAREFYAQDLAHLCEENPLPISVELAHELVYGSIEFAARYGFKPHRDFKLAQLILDPPEAHPRTGTVEFGKDGKPFYISGPYDNVQAIMRTLMRTAGLDNFLYMVNIGDSEEWPDVVEGLFDSEDEE